MRLVRLSTLTFNLDLLLLHVTGSRRIPYRPHALLIRPGKLQKMNATLPLSKSLPATATIARLDSAQGVLNRRCQSLLRLPQLP
jgi:hypothetical protein